MREGLVTVSTEPAPRGLSFRALLLPLGAVLSLVTVGVGLIFLADKHGAQNLLGSIYDLLGNPAAASAARSGVADQLLAKLTLAAVALIAGVGGIWLLYSTVAQLVSLLRPNIRDRIMPWVFVVPALLLLLGWLVYPTVVTIYSSFLDDKTGAFTLANWAGLASKESLGILFNNALWLVVGTGGAVFLGLVIAALFDRVRLEAMAKTFVFLPLAISLVGASLIWRFVYTWRPEGQAQYGLLNAIWTGLGQQPVDWIHNDDFHINTFLMIIIFIWLQTGFAMVVLSAAIKGVSAEVLEAARLDGANERQIFFGVIVPIIKGSILAVITTIAIADLKIFDIVFVMTGGRFDTNVVANQMFLEAFQFFADGRAAALATVLFIAVLPVMYINLRNLREQGVGR
jgi:alpha-glucoside transport system permease protein